MMRLSDFKVGLRQLCANPGHTATVLLGLMLALASSLILFAYVDVNLNADVDVPERDRVFRLEAMVTSPGAPEGWITGTPWPFYDSWAAAGAPVQLATRYYPMELSIRAGDRLVRQEIGFVDPEFTAMFGLKALAGDLTNALSRPDTAVVSVRSAQKLFGSTDAVGKTLLIGGTQHTVAAVIADRSPGSAIATGVLINIKSPAMPEQFRFTHWLGMRGQNFVKLPPNASPTDLATRAANYLEQTPAYKELPPAFVNGPRKLWSARAVALPDIPLSGSGSDDTRRMLWALVLSSLLISALAIINYSNLSTVRTLSRQREIGIRKSLGAAPAQIAQQFLMESGIVALASCLLAIPLALALAPMVGEWINQPLSGAVLSAGKLVALLAIALMLALLAGAYPAWVAFRINCARVMVGRGQAESASNLWLRRASTVTQFAIAMVLLGSAIVILWQANFASRIDPGYDPRQILAIEAPIDMKDGRLAALREAIGALPGVAACGISKDVPGRGKFLTSSEARSQSGQSVTLAFDSVGPGFFQTYDIQPLAGRVFDPNRDKQGATDIVVINASGAKRMGFADAAAAVGQRISMEDVNAEIIGVVPDIRQHGLREAPRPALYGVDDDSVQIVSVRAADVSRTAKDIEALWQRYFPNDVLMLKPVREYLSVHYDADQRFGLLIGSAGLIALLLAGCGVYAMSAYSVRRKSREVVLRKLHGAGGVDVARLLGKEFAVLLGIGALIGLPIAAWLGERYLSGYVNRAPVGLWAPCIALAITTLVALLATTRHTLSAMRMKPVEALRD